MNNQKKSSNRGKPRKRAQAAVVTLTDLDRIKLLAEPIRLKLLGAFSEEKTTKQVADELGEKPTRLYHHVAALERAGLIELTRTAPNRGTTEKYYRAIARAYRAEVAVVPSAGGEPELASVVRTMFTTAADEAQNLLIGEKAQALSERGVLGFLELRIGSRQAAKIQRDLTKVLDRAQAPGGGSPADGEGRYRLAIAFFPLDS